MSKTLTRYHIKRASSGTLTDMKDSVYTLIVQSRVVEGVKMKSQMLFKGSLMMDKDLSMFSKRKVTNATRSLEICQQASS
jgi:hypothetical protein